MKLWIITAMCLVFGSSASAQVLYQDDFESSKLPGYIVNFGKPEIVGPTGEFTTNSLAFNTSHAFEVARSARQRSVLVPQTYYDQIQYLISKASEKSTINLSFDICIRGLIDSDNSFMIYFDSPAINLLNFGDNGNIYADCFKTKNSHLTTHLIHSFVENQKMHFDVLFDGKTNIFNVYIDQKLVFEGQIREDNNTLRTIRFHLSHMKYGKYNPNSTINIDNILITSED